MPLSRVETGPPGRRSRRRRTAQNAEGPGPVPVDWSAIDAQDLSAPALYINRELSWLEFNRRVLAQAQDPGHPLLERVKFLSIFSSNLDEFFMVRVAGIVGQVRAGDDTASRDGLRPSDQVAAIKLLVTDLSTGQLVSVVVLATVAVT